MLRTIAHRGPDDQGVHVKDGIGLGNCRLSIIDLPGGHQPLCNEDGTVWIVYNGEIYNYERLRGDLETKGHVFRTHSDTEVIVHLYEELGEHCVVKLSGMFAFAIWDEPAQKLVLARDRIGQKPLFYAQDGEDFLFASEVKAILAVLRSPRDIDYESLHHYLSLRFIPSPHTMLQQVKKLAPAHILVHKAGQTTIRRYWDLSFEPSLNLPEAEILDGLREKLKRAVDSHLVSDVPLGAFLSGGMDSSMIVATMAKSLKVPFNTFAVGVKEQSFNELPYARLVAERFGTRHIERFVGSDLIATLPKIIWQLDEPSDPIAACTFHAAELAAGHVKVVLGGDGGDELFAGFDRYWGMLHVERFTRVPAIVRQRIIGPAIECIPDSYSYKSITQKLRWVNQLSQFSDAGRRYAAATCFSRFSHQGKRALFSDHLWSQVADLDSGAVIATHFDGANAADLLGRMLYVDYMTRLPEHSMMLTDRMAMAHGLEVRSPFLDHELVEYMAAVPSRMKIRGRELKYALRKVAADHLPDQIIRRKKQGFMFPVAHWFRNELSPFVERFLLESHFAQQGVFQKETVLQLVRDHRLNRMDNHVRLWMLLNLELWHQLYIQRQDLSQVSGNIERHMRG